jgi:hypothetical protein
MQLRFDVGEQERHEVVFSFNKTTGWLVIKVDDVPIKRRLIVWSMSLAVCVDADVAIWEVGAHSRWAPVLGTEVADVVVGYEPDDAGGLWCPCIRVTFRTAPIDLILGDVQPDQQLSPSADNIAVLFNAR